MFNKDKIMKKNTVVHCENETEWKSLCDWMTSELGYNGWTKQDFRVRDCDCVYVNDGSCKNLGYYTSFNYTIIPYAEALSSYDDKPKLKFKVGDKVVPISYWGRDNSSSSVWGIHGGKEQGYLFVASTTCGVPYKCNVTEEETGDYFEEKDLVPYIPMARFDSPINGITCKSVPIDCTENLLQVGSSEPDPYIIHNNNTTGNITIRTHRGNNVSGLFLHPGIDISKDIGRLKINSYDDPTGVPVDKPFIIKSNKSNLNFG